MSPVEVKFLLLGAALVLGVCLWIYEALTEPGARRRSLDSLRRCRQCGSVLAPDRTTCPYCRH